MKFIMMSLEIIYVIMSSLGKKRILKKETLRSEEAYIFISLENVNLSYATVNLR